MPFAETIEFSLMTVTLVVVLVAAVIFIIRAL